jgi:Tol biopolymer transport system component
MKRCPECRRDYYDDTLIYCLDDGNLLLEGPASVEQSTIILPGGSFNDRSVFTPPSERPPIFQARMPKLSQITFSEAIEEYPSWSPNSEELAFSREEAGIRSIFVKNIITSEERQLTVGDHDDIQPTWSPDGRSILFVRARKPRVKLEPGDVFGLFYEGDIWAMDLETGNETRLIENAFNPDFALDGKRIAFDASWAGPRRIWAVDSLGHNPQQLTSDSSEGISHVRPRWAPDGRRIVFQNIERTKFDVRVFDLASARTFWVTSGRSSGPQPGLVANGEFHLFFVVSRRRHQHLACVAVAGRQSRRSTSANDYRRRAGR